MQGTTGS
ncbi:unnamed protein product [Linum tenue]|nr:unnamed protein product [Linum tenue]